jgi:Nucleotidyl transferase AbiEii toxin, Type IV TA system
VTRCGSSKRRFPELCYVGERGMAGATEAEKWNANMRLCTMPFVPRLTPKLDVLPVRQRKLWHRLGTTPKDFVLYGGTALALRLGHRESVDFDFFSCRAFKPVELIRSIDYLQDQHVTQQEASTLSCSVASEGGIVSVSFFGGLSLRQIVVPDVVASNGIAIASLRDIFGMKCATVPQRSEAKDYRDIHALITQGRIDLAEGIAAAKAIYGEQYEPLLTLQALAYFDDLPEPLGAGVEADLTRAVKAVSLQNLPAVAAVQRIGDGIART